MTQPILVLSVWTFELSFILPWTNAIIFGKNVSRHLLFLVGWESNRDRFLWCFLASTINEICIALTKISNLKHIAFNNYSDPHGVKEICCAHNLSALTLAIYNSGCKLKNIDLCLIFPIEWTLRTQASTYKDALWCELAIFHQNMSPTHSPPFLSKVDIEKWQQALYEDATSWEDYTFGSLVWLFQMTPFSLFFKVSPVLRTFSALFHIAVNAFQTAEPIRWWRDSMNTPS